MTVGVVEGGADVHEGYPAIAQGFRRHNNDLGRAVDVELSVADPFDQALIFVERNIHAGALRHAGLPKPLDQFVDIRAMVIEQIAVPEPLVFLHAHRVKGGGQRQCVEAVDRLLHTVRATKLAEARNQGDIVVGRFGPLRHDALDRVDGRLVLRLMEQGD